MGHVKTYGCNHCSYSVLTSAGLDWGMFAVTDTYICRSCIDLVEVTVGKYGKVIKKQDIPKATANDEFDITYYVCPKCGSDKHLIKWSVKNRPCPKCTGRMFEDPEGESMLWD